jgi:hypothetical protein
MTHMHLSLKCSTGWRWHLPPLQTCLVPLLLSVSKTLLLAHECVPHENSTVVPAQPTPAAPPRTAVPARCDSCVSAQHLDGLQPLQFPTRLPRNLSTSIQTGTSAPGGGHTRHTCFTCWPKGGPAASMQLHTSLQRPTIDACRCCTQPACATAPAPTG